MVFCAQASQFQMCTSVPQMLVLRILISTSLMPTSGTGTSSSQRPTSRFALTSAFMVGGQLSVVSGQLSTPKQPRA